MTQPFAHQTQDTQAEPAQKGSLLCAVIHAGADVALAIEHRPGRFPAELTLVREPIIGWRCQDGVDEYIEITGEHAQMDFQTLSQQCADQGLLVAEVTDMADINVKLAHYSILGGVEPKDELGEPSP